MKNCLILIVFSIVFFSCKKDERLYDDGGFPKDIAKIMASKCATSGCHNDASAAGAGGLNLSSWEKMFQGSRSGSVIIPYRSDFSSLMYFVNTYEDLGLSNQPTMPLYAEKLSREEIIKLKNWIDNGAQNANGKVKFSGSSNRKKFYVVNQGCGVVTVFDSETSLPMRYITVKDPGTSETPHQIKVSPDGKYWTVCFIQGQYLKVYETANDQLVAKIPIGSGDWNTMSITPDSKHCFVVDWSTGGKVAKCNLQTMQRTDSIQYPHLPHGSAISPDGNWLYLTATGGNYLYKIDVNDFLNYDYVSLNPLQPGGLASNFFNPHEIWFSPDGSKYAVSCSGNADSGDMSVKIFKSANDSLLFSVPLLAGAYELAWSNNNILFVTSYEGSFNGFDGYLALVNPSNGTLIKYMATGTQPHGIAINEQMGLVYVANRNVSSSGQVPHHSSVCGGKNGSVVFISLTSLLLTGRKVELSNDPYTIAIRN